MLGAVIGDIVGSVHEGIGTRTKDFPLFIERLIFTDDSVLTVAVADWILTGDDLIDLFSIKSCFQADRVEDPRRKGQATFAPKSPNPRNYRFLPGHFGIGAYTGSIFTHETTVKLNALFKADI